MLSANLRVQLKTIAERHRILLTFGILFLIGVLIGVLVWAFYPRDEDAKKATDKPVSDTPAPGTTSPGTDGGNQPGGNTTTTTEEEDNTFWKSWSTGGKAGFVIACVLVAIIIVAAIYFKSSSSGELKQDEDVKAAMDNILEGYGVQTLDLDSQDSYRNAIRGARDKIPDTEFIALQSLFGKRSDLLDQHKSFLDNLGASAAQLKDIAKKDIFELRQLSAKVIETADFTPSEADKKNLERYHGRGNEIDEAFRGRSESV